MKTNMIYLSTKYSCVPREGLHIQQNSKSSACNFTSSTWLSPPPAGRRGRGYSDAVWRTVPYVHVHQLTGREMLNDVCYNFAALRWRSLLFKHSCLVLLRKVLDTRCSDILSVVCFVCMRRSSSRTAAFLHSAGKHGGGVRRRSQPHVRGRRVANAARQVAAWSSRVDAGEQCADRQERLAADWRTRDGHIHVCRSVRTRQYWVWRRGSR